MTSSQEKSVEELRRESERTREDLASTVTKLRDRLGDTTTQIKTVVSPDYIKQEIRGYVRQERESTVAAVQRTAKENPLQVAAVAAAAAYPALGLLRALPAPLWLIGAGLFLTSKKGRQITSDAKARVDDVVQQGAEKLSDLTDAVRSDLQDRMAGAGDELGDAVSTVSSTVSGMTDKARVAFQDARDAVTGVTQDGTSKAKSVADRASATVSETANTMKRRADEMTRTTRYAVSDFVNDNALLVAAVGAVVGAVIAASIPSSEAENRLFGTGSVKLKEKAREAAAEGIEKAGDFAAETAGAVAAAAAREGLDAAGVQSALNNVADSVRAVADRGIDTALGKKQPQEANNLSDPSPLERNPS